MTKIFTIETLLQNIWMCCRLEIGGTVSAKVIVLGTRIGDPEFKSWTRLHAFHFCLCT